MGAAGACSSENPRARLCKFSQSTMIAWGVAFASQPLGGGCVKQRPVAVPEVSVSNKLNKWFPSAWSVSLPSLNIYVNVSMVMGQVI